MRVGFYGDPGPGLHETGSDGGEQGSSPLESGAEEFAQRALANSRRLLIIGGIILGILMVIALVMSKFSDGH